MTANIKKSARRFLREYKINILSFERISKIIKSQGYKIIRFCKAYNDENIEILINVLGLKEYVQAYSAFTYVDNNYRLVFLEDNISEQEALILLTHEEGHIYNGHFGKTVIAGENTTDEFEANEFTHYLLNPPIINKAFAFISTHKIISIMLCCSIFVTIGGSISTSIILTQQTYYREYYATPSGKKYHKAECIYIRDRQTKRRVSKDDIKKEKLEPCKVCLPELRKD